MMKRSVSRTLKKALSFAMVAVMAVSCLFLSACGPQGPVNENFHKNAADLMDQWVYVDKTTVLSPMGVDQGKEVEVEPCYALENVLYCANPEDEECAVLSIYVPTAYVEKAEENGDGTYKLTFNKNAVFTNDVGTEYTVDTAPIIYQTSIDGYKEGYQLTLGTEVKGIYGNVATDDVSRYDDYVAAGYIFVCVSSRGVDSNLPVSDDPMAGAMGTGGHGRELASQGAAPSQIVDLKAGVRYLKHNNKVLPGDSEKIIAVGGSAGGSCVALLGVSGNSKLYDPYLEEIGAIMSATDSVYGVRAQAPIANVELADMAYEYLHSGETAYNNKGSKVDMTEPGHEFELALHNLMVEKFEAYLGDLGLDAATFRDGYLDAINAAIDKYLDHELVFHTYGLLKQGNVSAIEYRNVLGFVAAHESLTRNGDDAQAASMEEFIADFMPRSKSLMAFDTEAGKSWETKLFGGVVDGESVGEHFSASLLAALQELSGEYEEAARLVEVYSNDETGVNSEGKQDIVKLMSCMTFLSGEEKSDIAQHWRLCNSTMDGDVGSLMAYLMACVLEEKMGIEDVDFFLGVDEISGNGHGFCDFNFLEVEAYIDEMCTGKDIETPELPGKPLVTVEAVVEDKGPGGPGGSDSNAADGDIYTYMENFLWTLVLKTDGTFALTEDNDFAGRKTYTGTYSQDGNHVTIDGLEPAPHMFKWADPAGFTVTLDGKKFTPDGYEG